MAKNMYGVPLQNYVALGNVIYPADANGLILNVPDHDVFSLLAQRCLDEDSWLKLQAAHPVSVLPTVRTVSGTTDTILAADNGNIVYYTNGSAVAVGLPDGLSGGGFSLLWIQGGAGKLTFTGSGGATAQGEGGKVASSGTQYAQGSVVSPVTHTFVIGGSTS